MPVDLYGISVSKSFGERNFDHHQHNKQTKGSIMGLMIHDGAQLKDENFINSLPAPLRKTDTHVPIEHSWFINKIKGDLDARGIRYGSGEYAVTPDNERMFGLLEYRSSASHPLTLAVNCSRTPNSTNYSDTTCLCGWWSMERCPQRRCSLSRRSITVTITMMMSC